MGVNWSQLSARTLENGIPFLRQFAYLGAALLAAGLLMRQPLTRKTHLLLLFTVALYALYTVAYDSVDAALFFLPGMLILSLYLALGLSSLGRAAILLPVALLVLNFTSQDLSDDLDVAGRATGVLQAAPKDALLMSPGDHTIFALWYYHLVAGERPDIALVDRNLFAFGWYRQRVGRQYPDLMHVEIDDLSGFESENQHRPLCNVSLVTQPFLNCVAP
jgi:hypothetical protein